MKNVEIYSAFEMEKKHKERLETLYRGKYGDVSFSYFLDPSLLGGFKAICDHEEFDGTVKDKLKAIKNQLKNI